MGHIQELNFLLYIRLSGIFAFLNGIWLKNTTHDGLHLYITLPTKANFQGRYLGAFNSKGKNT